jgi:hypothetical protein
MPSKHSGSANMSPDGAGNDSAAPTAAARRTADGRVNDVSVELKSLDPGASDRTVKAALTEIIRP